MFDLIILSRQIALFFVIPCFLTGILGGIFNIMVFSSLQLFRQNSCAFYLMMMSSFNIAQMLIGLFSRILTTGFDIDWTMTSLIYCKFKYFSLQFTAIMSSTCLCLATIDQYLATCTHRYWQRYCQIKLACRIFVFVTIIMIFEQSPTLVFYTHSSPINGTCLILNKYFDKFNLFFNRAILWYSLPILVNLLFGILAYCNIKQITYRTIPLVRRELDKQLTMMVFIQVLLNFLIIIPSLIIGIILFRTTSLNQQQIQAAHAINSCVFYFYFAVRIKTIFFYCSFSLFLLYYLESILHLHISFRKISSTIFLRCI